MVQIMLQHLDLLPVIPSLRILGDPKRLILRQN